MLWEWIEQKLVCMLSKNISVYIIDGEYEFEIF